MIVVIGIVVVVLSLKNNKRRAKIDGQAIVGVFVGGQAIIGVFRMPTSEIGFFGK
jgi:hypothetical protein